MMRRLDIGQSLGDVAIHLITEWRMLLAISWLPLLLVFIGTKLYAHNNSTPFVSAVMDMSIKTAIITIAITGIYRYLLADPRFRLHTISVRPGLTFQWYFRIDRATALLAAILLIWGFFCYYTSYLIVFPLSDSPSYSLRTLSQLWKIALFFLGTQFCLIFPYIAVSHHPTWRRSWKNVQILTGNRIRVWLVQIIIAFCILLVNAVLHFVFGHGNANAPLFLEVVLLTLWHIRIIGSVIFATTLFQRIGVRDTTPQ